MQKNKYIKKYVYDLPTRLLHAGIGLCTLLLLLTAALAHFFFETGAIRHGLWGVHIYLGNLLLVFLSFRFIYMFIGPEYSRLSNFIKLNEWREILVGKRGPVNWPWGHHPVASLFYLALYLSLIILSATGLLLSRIQFDQGPVPEKYFDDVTYLTELMKSHEALAWFVLAFTLMHLSALIYHSSKDKIPAFESMRTGYQYKHDQPGEVSDEKN